MSLLQNLTRRDVLRTAGLGTAGLALAACAAPVAPAGGDSAADSAAAPSQEPVNVTLISWWNHPFRDLLPAFNDLHPDIQVEFIDSGTGYNEKVMTAMVSGSELTDIIGSQDSNLQLWAATGGLADISDYMEPHEDRIVPYKLTLGVYEGKNYGFPWDGSLCLMYYRRDIAASPDPDARRAELEDMMNKYRSPFLVAEAFDIEKMIDPRDTRPFLSMLVEAAQSPLKRNLGPKPKYGVRP